MRLYTNPQQSYLDIADETRYRGTAFGFAPIKWRLIESPLPEADGASPADNGAVSCDEDDSVLPTGDGADSRGGTAARNSKISRHSKP